MSVAAVRPPPTLNATLQENARVFAIGVSSYDAFPDRPVRSATANALAWLVVALRMGVSPYTNPLMVEEAGDRPRLAARLREVLEQSDLNESERQGLRELVADVETVDAMGWQVSRPTYGEILHALMLVGNHLEWNRRCRLLLTFSGHGAVDRGALVLCPADTDPTPAVPTRAELDARLDGLVQGLVGRGDPYMTGAKLIRSMATEAARKGVEVELFDTIERVVGEMGTRYRAEVVLDLLRFVQRNLRRIPAQGRRSKAQLGRVLTHVHLLLALGVHDDRVTLVLDACHSGGPSGTLQGSVSGHGWTAAGLRCRIFSATDGVQLAVEARIGDRRFSAATWALTQVLSRWERVEDGPAYALGIRNGELVLRANQLLGALSFRQQIALHAPVDGEVSAADMPFFGLEARTRTVVDPDSVAGGIELSGETDNITQWTITQGGALRAVLLAVGTAVTEWSYTWNNGVEPPVTQVYKPGKLYILSTAGNVQLLAGQPFDVTMAKWNGQGAPPAALTSPLNAFSNKPLREVQASGDPGERPYAGPANLGGTFSYQLSAGTKVVFLRWLAPYDGDRGKLHFISKQGFPYTPADFGQGALAFTACPSPGFDGTCVEHLIAL